MLAIKLPQALLLHLKSFRPRWFCHHPLLSRSLYMLACPHAQGGEAGAGSVAHTRNDVTVLGPESLASLVPGAAARAEVSGGGGPSALGKRAVPEPEVDGSAQAEEEEEEGADELLQEGFRGNAFSGKSSDSISCAHYACS